MKKGCRLVMKDDEPTAFLYVDARMYGIEQCTNNEVLYS